MLKKNKGEGGCRKMLPSNGLSTTTANIQLLIKSCCRLRAGGMSFFKHWVISYVRFTGKFVYLIHPA